VICRYREQVCGLTGQDYSFVSNPAKRKFFMSVPRTTDRQGKYPVKIPDPDPESGS
jgi:hypothetical protein